VRRILLAGCLLAVLAAAPAGGRAGDDEGEPRPSSVLAALGSPRADDREAALARLEAWVRRGDALGTRAVRPLVDVLRRRPPREAARAVALLAHVPQPRARQAWLGALDPTADPLVFRAAVEAARSRADDAEAVKALLERARDDKASDAARALALEALGHAGGEAARLLLARPVEAAGGERWLLASGRALGLACLGGREAASALLDLLGHPHEAVRVHAWEGLVTLTRQSLPAEEAPWRAWWQAHPDALRSPIPVGEAGAEGDVADRYGGGTPAHVPRYYGIPIDRPRSRVVFCIDVSQSMYGRGIEQARAELRRTLEAFPTTYAFEVIAFNERLHPFAGDLVPAHPVVKARALAWLDSLETISYTNLYDAVETAFGHAGIGDRAVETPGRLDAVFLLSDGAPNRGRYRREDKVVEAIAALSRRRIPVHAVAAGEEVFPLLRRIADATGGRFVDAFEYE